MATTHAVVQLRPHVRAVSSPEGEDTLEVQCVCGNTQIMKAPTFQVNAWLSGGSVAQTLTRLDTMEQLLLIDPNMGCDICNAADLHRRLNADHDGLSSM